MQTSRNQGRNEQGTENLGTQLGDNQFEVNPRIWSTLDGDQREIFNRVYETERQRKNELIENLSTECRDTVSMHFDHIIQNVILNVVRHVDLKFA